MRLKRRPVHMGRQAHKLGGNFFQPFIWRMFEVPRKVAKEETFGQLAPCSRLFSDEARTLSGRSTDTEFGLGRPIFSVMDLSCVFLKCGFGEALITASVGIIPALSPTKSCAFRRH